MKVLIRIALIALAAPALAFAQGQPSPVTPAEVHKQILQLEQAGYNPARNGTNYPADIQAAEAKVAAQNNFTDVHVVGGVSLSGTSMAGSARTADVSSPLFARH
jgi:Domain of unknown function (DUF4148)